MRIHSNQNLKVLFVCSGNHDRVPAFIIEQKEELEKKGIRVDIFQIKGRGVLGYLKNYTGLRKIIRENAYDLIHAHFGLSGLFANLQRKLPVVTTFHGCDLNNKRHRRFSKYAAKLSKKVIVVSNHMTSLLSGNVEKEVIPCGVDMSLFVPMDKEKAREELMKSQKMVFDNSKKYILFSSTFDRDVKNPQLAMKAVAFLGEEYELIELKNFSRNDVVLVMNAVDAVLMTSKTEGSPQFIKEAMACNRPIVTTNVGDVEEIINGTNGCFITAPAVETVAGDLKKTLQYKSTTGREAMGQRYDNEALVSRIIQLYSNL